MANDVEPVVVSEHAFAGLPKEHNPNALLTHFKLVGIGPKTLARIGGRSRVAHKVMDEQPNFYIYASKEDMRAALHHYVDVFCNKQGI